ncbi:Myc-type [Macleaya cordata]|uniref:Myc-type n=1 Tax=Macleaya cordata TaxID=56857 RepID=A0A200QBZ1_MACCD|nr:Myc-type [Macleaya cordata]
MGDEYHSSSGICSSTGMNWWNSSSGGGISSSSSSRNGLSSSSSPPCSTNTHISSTTTDNNNNNIGGSSSSTYGWCNNNDHHQMMEMIKTKPNCDQQSSSSVSVSGSSSIVYQSSSDHAQRPPDQAAAAGSDSIGGHEGSVLMDSNLQMMGFDLSSSPTTDWTQTLLRSSSGRAAETNFHSMLQETSRLESDHGHHHIEEDSSSIHAFNKQMNQVFNLDPTQCFNSASKSSEDCTIVTCQGLPMNNFSMNSSSATNYECAPSSTTLLHGLYEPADQQSSLNYSSYCMNSNELISPSWSSKFPQFLKTTTAPPTKEQTSHNQLHFSNNAPFWNASSCGMMTDIRSSLFSSPRQQFLTPTLDHDHQMRNCSNLTLKPNTEVRGSGSQVKKSSTNEPAFKRPRIETPSPLPTFKVRKEKLGDRITALQQLCSPFGKTDTASVLYEAIEYIKFLHDQVTALSNPYMKNGAPQQYQQNLDKSKDGEGLRQDLRSRGLCLVPISSTFTVTNETSTDFWTPTFGGTYR